MDALGPANADPEQPPAPADSSTSASPGEGYSRDGPSTPEVVERQPSIIQVDQAWSGPLPPPGDLEAYEEILSGAAERIFRMAEIEQSHRIDRENKQLDLEGSAIDTARTGVANQLKIGIMSSVFGFILGLVGTVGGLALCWIGRWEAGLPAFLFALAALVGLFLYEANARRTEHRRNPQSASEP